MTKLENSVTDNFRPGAKGREEAAHKTWENERGNEVVRRCMRACGGRSAAQREGGGYQGGKEGGREEGRQGKRGNREFHFEARDLASEKGIRPPSFSSASFLPFYITTHDVANYAIKAAARRRPAKFLSLFTKGGGGGTGSGLLAAGWGIKRWKSSQDNRLFVKTADAE